MERTRKDNRKERGFVYMEESMEEGINGISVNISHLHVDRVLGKGN
jgi:hypothetical protein